MLSSHSSPLPLCFTFSLCQSSSFLLFVYLSSYFSHVFIFPSTPFSRYHLPILTICPSVVRSLLVNLHHDFHLFICQAFFTCFHLPILTLCLFSPMSSYVLIFLSTSNSQGVFLILFLSTIFHFATL